MKKLFYCNSQLIKFFWLGILITTTSGAALGVTFTVTKTADTNDPIELRLSKHQKLHPDLSGYRSVPEVSLLAESNLTQKMSFMDGKLDIGAVKTDVQSPIISLLSGIGDGGFFAQNAPGNSKSVGESEATNGFRKNNSVAESVPPASNVATFTSTTSGGWNDPATWGGAGVPGPNDAVVIAAQTTVFLDTDRSIHNLTLFGNLDLNGHRFDMVGEGAVFNYSGGIQNSNSATFNTFNLVGNGTPGGLTQTLVGSTGGGGCNSTNFCNFVLRLTNGVKVISPTGTVMGNNLTIDAGSEFDISGGWTYWGGTTVASVITNNGTVRNGRLTTERLVRITGSGTYDTEIVIDSGTAQVQGEIKRLVGVQSQSTLRLTGALNLYGDLIINSGGIFDMFGSPVQFLGNNASLINTGTMVNNSGHNTFSFAGNGVAGGVTQTLLSGVSPFPINSTQRLMDNVTLNLGADATFAMVFIQAGSTLNASNQIVRLKSPGLSLNVQGTILTTGSTVEMNGAVPQSIATNLNGAAYNNLTINNPSGVDIPNPGANPLLIPGTLRLTAGTFTVNGNLNMGNGSTIARNEGSISGIPNFGSSVNLSYLGFQSITSGAEIPTTDVLNNLVLETFGNSAVTLNSDVVVNGTLTVSTDRTLAGAPGRSLSLRGSAVVNSGTVTHPSVTFDRSGAQTLSGFGSWSGNSVAMNGPGTITLLTGANFLNASFINNTTIATGSNFFTFTGSAFTNAGVITGNFQTQETVTLLDAGVSGFNAAFRVWSGTTTAKGRFNSSLTIQSAAATLQVAAGETVTVTGNTILNGPLNGGGIFRTNGASVTNTALVSVASFQLGGTTQSLGGIGGFSNNTVTILGGSSTTLTANKQMSSIAINAGASFNFPNRSLFLSGAGTPFTNAGAYSSSNSTVEYNGTSLQTLSSTVPTYFNLSLNNASGTNGFSGLTVNGLLTVKAGTFTGSSTTSKDVQINGGATLAGTDGTTFSISGNWTNNGSFLPNLNTVNISGTTAQSLSGTTATTFDNLTTSAGSNLVLGKDIAVNRILALGADLVTGANTLTQPSTGTSAGTADVIGNVRRTGFVAGGSAKSFGNPFNTIAFAATGTIPSEVTFNLAKVTPVGFPEAVQRTYAISQIGGTGFSATLRLHYLDAELNGNLEPDLKLFRLNGSWLQQGANAIDTRNNWVEKSGVTQFSQWALRSAPAVFRVPFDFDGDGKTDLSIFRPSVGEWWYYRSSDGGNYAAQFGNSSDKLVPADFTGDGKTDIAIFRPSMGEWFILRSEDGSYYSFPFGTSGDIPAPGDFDSDGKADAAVFRPSDSTWYIYRSSDGGVTIQTFGQAGDVPVVSDYDGDGKADIAIYRPSVGEWWIQKSTNSSVIAYTFGNSSDKPVQGDYTGDGKADVAIYRPSSGEWFILRSEDSSYYSVPFGSSGDVPSPGDYDGDGKFDTSVFRPSSSTWYVQRSTAGTLIQTFGQSGDTPVPNAFVP